MPLIFVFAFFCHGLTQKAPAEINVVWTDETRRQVAFVTPAALQTLSSDTSHAVMRSLRARATENERFAASARTYGHDVSRCGPTLVGDSGFVVEAPIKTVTRVPLAGVGTVMSIMPGWNVDQNRVTSIVSIRFDEVWKGSGIAIDDIVPLELPFGEIHIADFVLCSDMLGAEQIKVGSQLLVFGRLVPSAPQRLVGGAWPVADGLAKPAGEAALSIKSLREQVFNGRE